MHNSPLSKVSQEKFNKEEKKREEIDLKGGMYYKVSGKKRTTEENGSLFKNENYVSEPLNFSKKSAN